MSNKIRKKLLIQGIVQGVGFRPFVYRQALEEDLKGFVSNDSQGVEVEAEGDEEAVHRFIEGIRRKAPVLAKITHIDIHNLPVSDDTEFVIRASKQAGERTTLISPDISICPECHQELMNPEDRRYRYPFINCTNCGPRYTIINDIPYDRPNTTMSSFTMCPECMKEYTDPSHRRFHAQPNACPVCGPHVWLTAADGERIDTDDPIGGAIRRLKRGEIIAVKGLGGFHLACDATNDEAVRLLRQRKHREEKPLAVMAADLDTAASFAHISRRETDLLQSARRPIVLLEKRKPNSLAASVAPRNGYFGTMLPYTPLHVLLFRGEVSVLVMTSGNISEEPIAKDNDEAVQRLGAIADAFLMNNRDIYQRSDDSVVRIMGEMPRPVRRSRGYVPMPVFLRNVTTPVLAVGGELKNTIALTRGDQVFLSQHIGDMENLETLGFFEECVDHLSRILEVEPEVVAYDLHPDYLSTQWALKQKTLKSVGIQHHHAHIASCLAENGRDERVIGLAMDGTGYGTDGTIWGGEILLADLVSFERVGSFQVRPMPGGDRAIREPWRMGVAYLYGAFRNREEMDGDPEAFLKWIEPLSFSDHIPDESLQVITRILERSSGGPLTSSLGRLYDGVAAIADLRQTVAFEGQAAMELEMAMYGGETGEHGRGYTFSIHERDGIWQIDPDPVILRIREDLLMGTEQAVISRRFHTAVVDALVEVCIRVRENSGMDRVALSGGCFQNRFLFEYLLEELTNRGFQVYTHSQVPANDGGLALGQAVVAAARMRKAE